MDLAYLSNKRAEGGYSSYFCDTLAEPLQKQSNGGIYLRSQCKNIWSIMGRKAWVGLVCAGLRFWVDLEAEREGFSFITSSIASDMGTVLSTAPPNPASSGNKLQTSHSPAPSALD